MSTTAKTQSRTVPAQPEPDVRGERRAVPGLAAASRARAGVELRSYFRNAQYVVFTLMLPIMLLVIFASIFDGNVEGSNVPFRQYFIAGIIAAGVMSTAFTGLAISVAMDRENGIIRRLAISPMPKGAYFIGKVVLVIITSALEAAILLAIGTAVYGLELPTELSRWLTFAWVLALGTAACALLALAFTYLIPSANAAAAVVTPPFLILQFISGVFFPFTNLPGWMQSVASVFPLKWMTQGFRSVFLPDSFAANEASGAWDLQMVAIVLTAWIVVGGLAALLTFRWRGARVK
ncbi:ABC transporter permease [Demetria terragena]|uniref:ABC transporter permease n=1 Tax=Demetria terragena TaxID=63959 RepID=UPI000376BFA0|nr:ABC transporter permease [Demetria terragena]